MERGPCRCATVGWWATPPIRACNFRMRRRADERSLRNSAPQNRQPGLRLRNPGHNHRAGPNAVRLQYHFPELPRAAERVCAEPRGAPGAFELATIECADQGRKTLSFVERRDLAGAGEQPRSRDRA